MPDDNPYAHLPRVDVATGTSDNPYAHLSAVSPLDDNPSNEGTYRMMKGGEVLSVPYSGVRRAAQSGYVMQDRERFQKDAAADKNLSRFFPEIHLPEGVAITGLNSAGDPVFGPTPAPKPKGSVVERFGRGVLDQFVQPVTGTWHALADAPQTPEERALAQKPFGTLALATKRVLYDPWISEVHQAGEEWKQTHPLALHPTPADYLHRQLAATHTLGAIPVIGPALAQTGEKAGAQLAAGDWAGAAGTTIGFGAVDAAPKLMSDLAHSEYATRTAPKNVVTRLIRPMKGDLQFGKSPEQAILDEGITGWTLEGIGNKVSDKLHEVGQKIDEEAKKYPNKKVNVVSFLQPINDAMAEAAKAGHVALFERLGEIKQELTSEYSTKPFRTAAGKITTRRIGPRRLIMSPEEALEFKRMIGDRVQWTQDPLQGPINEALGAAYGKVRDALNRQVPELERLNERFSNLVGAAKAIQRRIPIENRNAHWSLSDIVIGEHSIPLAVGRKLAMQPIVRTTVPNVAYRVRKLPAVPPLTGRGALTVPVAALPQSQQYRQRPRSLRELREEAARRRPAASAAP